jgi:hypothetical protein
MHNAERNSELPLQLHSTKCDANTLGLRRRIGISAAEVQRMWRFGEAVLGEASESLQFRLEAFRAEMDRDPHFGPLPTMSDNLDYFLTWFLASVRFEAREVEGLEVEQLRPLDWLVIFIDMELRSARYFVSHDPAQSELGWTAVTAYEAALQHVRAAERALVRARELDEERKLARVE